MTMETGRQGTSFQKEQWLKEKYDTISNQELPGYCFVSITLKNFREYEHNIGHELRETMRKTAYDALSNCLEEQEWMIQLYPADFHMIIKCDANETALHTRAHPFHFAIRDTMEEAFGQKLYVAMGFYPITNFDVDFYNAQYYAKEAQKGTEYHYKETNYDMYEVSYKDQKEAFRKMEGACEEALQKGHFKLYLQPKVNMKTNQIESAEALMRWVDPSKGIIPLSQFLANIEENGFIRDVDLYLFEEGCKHIQKWRKELKKDIQISFNLSNAYFRGSFFLPEYKEVFEKYDIPGKCICIELLESIILNDLKRLRQIVSGIYDMGFECALDDFGSGFSSFDILTNVTLSELKIDRSLFQNIENAKERRLLKSIVDISHDFGMRAVGEGIETKEYADYMKSIGCDYIQGFYYYKPMPIEEFEQRFLYPTTQ